MDVHKKFTFDDPEDSYWNESASTSFFEDPKEAASAARLALASLAESRDNFSGSARPAAGSVASGDDSVSIADSDRPMSEMEAEFRSKVGVTSTPIRKPNREVASVFNESGGSLTDFRINGNTPKTHFSTASIVSDNSIGSYTSESTVHLDYSRLKSEHRKLQRHLEFVRAERFKPPSPEEAVRRLCACQPVALDFYRSRQNKVDLLDAALVTLDRDVIVRVVLFLKSSVSNAIFREVLIFKPDAAAAYLSHLRESGDTDELIDSLYALGRSDEAAMIEFTAATKRRDTASKVQSLKKCLVSGFSDPTLSSEANAVRDYINLLERQIPIDSTDEDMAKSGGETVFKQFPKKATLIGQPLLTTLYYCCLYHYDLPKNSYASPLSIREVFNIGDREFHWMAMSALARHRRYDEIEKVMTSKKLLAATKIICPLPWNAFFSLIFKYGAPPKDVLARWLRAVPDLEERLKICESMAEAREIQIETLIALKDRQKLTALISKMTPHTVEHNKAHIALANTAYKWKN
uniref:Vps16_C domain-containing protein n=1 Tax=Panagrellus redivivus TaxID=6233 RepID=A0A7E4UV39_PANRE